MWLARYGWFYRRVWLAFLYRFSVARRNTFYLWPNFAQEMYTRAASLLHYARRFST